ncbi:serine hydrolase domain-containing protein [Altererythrobacter sp. GH1-8]|uniref:serine hydrolase domain-containing protein n=1 Tax=Altererythrobacter sp. GH1-8 TaxID=3349333 RepID=UPI00374DB426
MNWKTVFAIAGLPLLNACAMNTAEVAPLPADQEPAEQLQMTDASGEPIPDMNVYEVTDTSAYSAEDEAEYLRRFNKLLEDARTGAGLATYEPLEAVPGAEIPEPLPFAETKTLSSEAIEQAHAYVAARNTSAFMIWKDGALQHEAYFGEFDRGTPIVSKSLAKPITVLLIGRAIMQGHINSLDQPVADFITEWKGDPEREKITLRHLLSMRSGMLPQGFSPKPEDMLNRAYLHPRHDEIIINDYPMTHEPGARYEYSNANAEIIAPIIERATGMRYSKYVSEALLKPIGAPGGSVWVNREGGTAHSGCCILLPAESWVRMAMLVMNDGVWEDTRLLPEGYTDAMRTGSSQNEYYGLGVWIAGTYIERRGYANPEIPYGKVLHSEPYLDKELSLFDGNSNQVVYMIPSQNMIILRTGATPPKDVPWDNTVLPNLLIADSAAMDGRPLPEPQPR